MTTTQPSAAVVASVERNTLERALAKPSAVLAPPQPAEEGKKERTETSAPRVFKQRKHRSPDELARELLAMPELTLDSVPGTSNKLVVSSRQPASQPSHAAPDFMVKRTDLAGLPFRMGLDCQIGKESAENLQVLSRKLRGYLAEAMPKDGIDIRLDADVLRAKLLKGKDGARGEWLQPEAVPALVQLLQAEDRPIRLLLVEVLSMNKDPSATAALAQRALFDLSCDVREAATQALKDRPRAEYQPLLLEVLRYPWAPVADHAAETLAYLGDGDVMPSLVKLLDDPDPTAPIVKIGKSQLSMVREVVRVNHLRNCLMCHAASSNPNDPVRGLIPTPGQPLPPGFTPAYYQGNGGLFVRADVTYLKQDFSVPQPVVRAEAWPVNQRNDYLVRTRLATAQEVAAQPKKPADYPQRDAVLFALRELTGKDAGPTSAGWRQLMAQAMVAKIKE